MKFVFSLQPFDEIRSFNPWVTDKILGFLSWSFNETRDFLSRPIAEIHNFFLLLRFCWWDSRAFFCNRLINFAFFLFLGWLTTHVFFFFQLLEEIRGFILWAISEIRGFIWGTIGEIFVTVFRKFVTDWGNSQFVFMTDWRADFVEIC